jgi:NAD(P)-dependent dehydrogenase (short-subunit alcohol dehydrogenase family)
VSRVLITGSTDGLGRAAAGALMDDGHDVVLHARTRERAASVTGLAAHAAGVVIGDLSSAAEIRALALTLARAWPEVASNAVDPGWVPTRMAAPEPSTIWRWDTSRRRGSPSATTQPPP